MPGAIINATGTENCRLGFVFRADDDYLVFVNVASDNAAVIAFRGTLLVSYKHINNPRLEKAESIITICSSRPLENVVGTAMLDLMEWMVTEYGINQEDAYMQLSVNPDVRVHVYQMILSDMWSYAAGVEIPKYLQWLV